MPGPSSWSLPVERCAVAISPHEVRKKIFAFIFQLSGWALVAPPCFVLMYEDLCSIRLTCFKLSIKLSAESLPVIYPRPPTQKLCLGTA